jgi:flagellar basal body-associated protein FliL
MAVFACRPVIAIGWPELIILVVIIVILLGPLMFRLYHFLDKIKKANQAEEKKKR